MNKTAGLLAIIVVLFSVINPIQAITYNTYKGIIGVGTIAGALIGATIYKKQQNSKLNKKRSFKSAIICSIGGAAATGLSLALLFYRFTPGCRFNQAEEIRRAALADPLLQDNDLNIANAANRHYRRYPLVYAEENMTTIAGNLQAAQTLYNQAIIDANNDQEFLGRCNQSNQETIQLNQNATNKAVALRGLDQYQTQVANQSKEQLTQERIKIEKRKATASEQKAFAAFHATQIAAHSVRLQEQKAQKK